METFEFNGSPSRVIFGVGTLRNNLPGEVARQGLMSPLILSTPRQQDQTKLIERLLDGKAAGVFTEAVIHTPIHVTEKALEYFKSKNADSVISIGGGSTIGLGKALCVRTGLPHICLPTTYSGTEMTSLLGETRDGVKKTRTDPKILPGTVIYDVELTMSLPSALTATSGVNAMAHAVEALYAQNTNPIMVLYAQEGIRVLASALPELGKDPSSKQERYNALYAAWLCSLCAGGAGVALHHKLSHTIGASFDLGHSEPHTIILPHSIAYNAPAVPKAMEQLAKALPGSNGDAIEGLNVLLSRLKVKRGLKELGMKEEDIDRATEIALGSPYWNPREIEKEKLREVIRRVWAGEPARADL